MTFSLNFAMAERMAQHLHCHNNFDSLFIPLRVVAAEIFTQREIILKKGVLGDALRATQTVPFFYNPIRVDGKYLFDGACTTISGRCCAEKFKPDVISAATYRARSMTSIQRRGRQTYIEVAPLFTARQIQSGRHSFHGRLLSAESQSVHHIRFRSCSRADRQRLRADDTNDA